MGRTARSPFVTELATGELDAIAFRCWLEQDYRYLFDYARTYAVAGAKAREEDAMATLLGGADAVLNGELDLHRSFASEYGVSEADLAEATKLPTCEAYTSFLVRTAYERPVPVAVAALFPCMQGYLDAADHMAALADAEPAEISHRYAPFIETYTSDEFRAETAALRGSSTTTRRRTPDTGRDARGVPDERSPRTRLLGDGVRGRGVVGVSDASAARGSPTGFATPSRTTGPPPPTIGSLANWAQGRSMTERSPGTSCRITPS